ncbi:MAG: TonB-dependent receptor domain-containing protein [Bacteroidota bacterium]
MKMLLQQFYVLIFVVLTASIMYAGNTGKIVGRVVDEKGEPLVGVVIKVLTTTRGAVTDPDGKYTIIGVPIGAFSVEANLIGYTSQRADNVKVGADATVSQNFKLSATTIGMPEIIIRGDKNLVNPLNTSSQKTVEQKQIEAIPNVKDVADIVKLQAGVVKQGNNLFLRGGRSNEVQYLVDGVPSNDIVNTSGVVVNANQQLSNLYAGMNAGVIGGGAGGLSVSANAISSVSVQTSGFDADYGNAQSGIISITTKSGSDSYSGSAQYRTDRIVGDNQNERYSAFSFGGPEPITKYLLSGMGVNVPGSLTFFVSADIDRADGPYNFIQNEFYNPVQRKAEFNGFLGGILNGTGFNFTDNQKNAFTLNSKLRYDRSSVDQFSYGYRASLGSTHNYNNAWKYRADSSNVQATLSTQHVFTWSHFFGSNSFIKMNLGKLENRSGQDVAGLTPNDYSTAFTLLSPPNNGFNYLGTDQDWLSSSTRVWSMRVDFNSQVHPLHLLKTGFEFYYEEINSTEIQYPLAQVPDSTGNLVSPPYPSYLVQYQHGLWPGYGQYRWNLNNYPNHGAAYVQDNIEFSGLNIHVGLRYDYFDLGHQIFYQDFIDAWKIAVQSNLNAGFQPQWPNEVPDGNSFKYYVLHGYVSPRLSIGYPVTDRINFYFNYGHFYQFPSRDEYYKDPYLTTLANNVIGNPDLKPQKTVQYESGFDDQFTDDMAFSIHAFYKDIFDYATTVPRGILYVYENLDYASARGFELSFTQSLSGNLTASASYAYQIAKGRSSNPLTSIYQPDFQLPRETRLDWDQNHTVNLFASYRVGARDEGTFFGLPFVNNYGISITYNFGSGFPYTPNHGQQTNAQNVYLVNSETRPYTATLNLTLYKGFNLIDRMNLTASLDVLNVLNRENIAVGTTGNGFNQNTGAPNHFGDVDPASNIIIPYYKADANMPPYTFDAPRQILLGIKLSWD